ncbi:DNA-binding response OmpR family regulator [Phyllobacterium myrsinacearum]|uniref:response regulator n=1 Tax=Phyllobacterium myrsinacearum TaxID=28101 RepID=UPI0010291FE1|nr:response regulator transcription factor [Phyllobacterium myrsinacearum]RZS77249.1 DNA-binding response OmpR family regulator [Phyllobacterium myrsinacearum]
MKLLLIEDDLEMADALRTALSQHGVVLDSVADLATAREAIAMADYDIVLIDRQLPDGDGSALLAEMRRSGKSVRSIIVSALGSANDRISGLNDGADDYLPKPFEIDELVARMSAVLRRAADKASPILVIGNVTYDHTSRDVYVKGIRLLLARRELLIFETFLRNRGRTVLRSLLEERVYSFNDEIQSNSLEVNLSRLRRKLADAHANLAIKNVRGIGYFLHELD